MRSELINTLDRLIRWSFYAIFFFVPLLIYPSTFELFEFNKIWFVFGMSLFIFLLWSAKAIATKQLVIRRTPLDIPLMLFLLSQIISTVFSMDPHVSWWGYYSRFNGGLLSTITYLFLYYAFASNCIIPNGADHPNKNISYKLLFVSLISGLAVALWGIPSHYGYDPTCLIFRGTLDVSCWTESFQPKVRIFATLGQPNWLGTYLGLLVPVSMGFGAVGLRKAIYNKRDNVLMLIESNKFIFPIFYLILLALFSLAVIFSGSQSSFLGVFVGINIFFTLVFLFTLPKHRFSLGLIKNRRVRFLFLANVVLLIIPFFFGSPVKQIEKYTTFKGWVNIVSSSLAPRTKQPAPAAKPAESQPAPAPIPLGGSDSGEIRKYVWTGALEIFKHYPVFGTGVETFAYAYYQYKPKGHNLTSEWDFLYNKAHNEYLNYLATTGAFGLGTYMLFICLFLFHAIKYLFKRGTHLTYFFPLSVALFGSFFVILISNFFGFSVVIVNLFLFFIPLIFYDLEYSNALSKTFVIGRKEIHIVNLSSPGKLAALAAVVLVVFYFEFYLFNFWQADQKYSLGYNLNHVGEYAQAYQPLSEAVNMLPGEPVYKDEFTVSLATAALLFAQQKQDQQARLMLDQTKKTSDEVVNEHPNNVVFWKTRTRVFYSLSQLNPVFLDLAIDAIQKAKKLAPTDAKITYNMALFYSQKGDQNKALQYFKESIDLKPNYVDARYGLALFYSQLAKKEKNPQDLKQKATEQLNYILTNIDPKHKASMDLLQTLK